MRRLNISHVTEYLFSNPVTLLPHRLLLRPRENHNVRIESSTLDILPAHTLQWKRDVLDNSVAVAGFTESSDRLRITSGVVIQHFEDAPLTSSWMTTRSSTPSTMLLEERAELAPFLQPEYPSDREAVHCWLNGLGLQRPMETFTLLDRVNREIAGRFFYQMREEPGVQPPALTLVRNSGSCRDFAALFMEACRHLRLASRSSAVICTRRQPRPATPRLMPGRRSTCPAPAEGIRSQQWRGNGQPAHRGGRGKSPGGRAAGGRKLHRSERPAPAAERGGAGQRARNVSAVHQGRKLCSRIPDWPRALPR
jgi:transglutaminase-like putative cysteine protease